MANEINDMIARLRREWAESDHPDYDTGLEEGVEYAKEAKLAELRSYEEQRDAVRETNMKLDDLRLPDSEWERLRQYMTPDEVVDETEYKRGWLNGLLSVWERAKPLVLAGQGSVPLKLATPPERKDSMIYYVYENWQAEGHKARIHKSSCSYCNNGVGIHPDAGTQHGQWLGPFNTFAEAHDAAVRTGGKVSMCKHCNPDRA